MKNVFGLMLGIGLIGLLALNLHPQEENNTSQVNATLLSSPRPTQEVLKEQTVAWYKYFDLKEINPQSQGKSPTSLLIKAEKKQTQEGFVIFKVMNLSNQLQTLKTQDGSLIMIQEALNSEGEWLPIEYWDYDWGLGSEFSQLELQSQHSVMITVPKFEGDFETKLRLKLKMNESQEVVYSEEFKAIVNLGQFNTPLKAKKTMSYLK
jgi:hypothetical protein